MADLTFVGSMSDARPGHATVYCAVDGLDDPTPFVRLTIHCECGECLVDRMIDLRGELTPGFDAVLDGEAIAAHHRGVRHDA